MPKRAPSSLIASIGLASCIGLSAALILTTWHDGPAARDLEGILGTAVTHVAGLLAAAPTPRNAGSDRAALVDSLYLTAYAALLLLFCLAFRRTAWNAAPRARRTVQWLLALQLLVATSAEPALLFVLAAELAWVLPLAKGLRWLAALAVAAALQQLFAIVVAHVGDGAAVGRLLAFGVDLVFYGLAFGVAHVAVLENRGRRELAAANAQLRATQSLLAETVRTSERLRIARELHDHVGHHLTALNLHLDLARRQSSGPLLELLDLSRGLSLGLLQEVRRAVGQARDEPALDLSRAIATLCAGIPWPAVRLEVAGPLGAACAESAHAAFRCIQEGLSNAVRHADARQILVEVHAQGDDLVARVSDDGHGSAGAAEGHGLRGMRERLAACRGTLRAGDRAQGGYALEARLPLARAA